MDDQSTTRITPEQSSPRARTATLSERLTGKKRPGNRKLRQVRPLRSRLPSVGQVVEATQQGARRSAPILIAVLGLTFASVGSYGLWRWASSSPRFAVTAFAAQGNTHVTADELARTSGVEKGTNLLALDTAAVEAALEKSPWVADASVTRDLPGTLVFEIVERQPSALVLAGEPYLADRDGRLFKRARLEDGEGDGLIVVTGIEREMWKNQQGTGEALVRAAVGLAGRWHADSTRPRLGEVHVSRRGMRVYTLDEAVAVDLGRDPENALEARLGRFDVIWAALPPEERALAKSIHLDSVTRPDRVTVRLEEMR